jgi:hypothetical protein
VPNLACRFLGTGASRSLEQDELLTAFPGFHSGRQDFGCSAYQYRVEDIAILASPDPGLITLVAVSPDGSQLAAAAHNDIQLWDLRIVRERLKELSLDWDAPPLLVAATPTRDTEPRRRSGNTNK